MISFLYMKTFPKWFQIGGCVRDELIGKRPNDIDFAVEADSYADMKRSVIARDCVVKVEHEEFVTLKAIHPIHGGVDFVLCRKDGAYRDGRRPESVEVGTLFDDQSRRDFRMNSIAKADDGTLIDPFNGIADIQAKLIQCVGDTRQRFAEDNIRKLRAIRFSIVLGFRMSEEIIAAIDENSSLEGVSPDRISVELKKCFAFDTSATVAAFNRFPYLAQNCFAGGKLILVPKCQP